MTCMFVLTGGLIVGLDLAVSSMKKGELARYIIRPQYAFGEMGTPPRIPKDATGQLKKMSIEFDKLYFYMSLSYPEDGILEYLKKKHFENKQQVKKFIGI